METPATMIRHVVRNSEGQTLYNENDACVAKVDNVMMFVYQRLAMVLNKFNKLQHKNKKDKSKQSKLSGALKNEFKNLGKLVGTLPQGTTVADFVVFGVLGSVTDKDLKKALKG